MKAAMLNAKSVKYAPMGAALMTVKKILSAFGIAGTIHDSSTLQAEVLLAAGEYEVDIYPVSEIISNKKLKNLGAVIPELQVPVIIEATVAKQTSILKRCARSSRSCRGRLSTRRNGKRHGKGPLREIGVAPREIR
jgi:hypothetical protein